MRKATRALLHASVHVASVGEIGTTIPPQSKTFEDLNMTYGPEGLVVDCTYNKLRISFAVPSANVKIVQLVPEVSAEKAPIDAKVKK